MNYSESEFPKPLSKEETRKCFELMRQGDNTLRQKLIEHNMGLVLFIIKKYFSRVSQKFPLLDFDDLTSIGTYGLIKAVDTFDIERKTLFSTYACTCIYNEIASFLKINEKYTTEISLDQPFETSKGKMATFTGVLQIDDTEIFSLEEKELMMEIKDFGQVLSDFERKIIDLRYGFSNGEPLTLVEIAKILGVSSSYIGQIIISVIAKIRNHLITREYILLNKNPDILPIVSVNSDNLSLNIERFLKNFPGYTKEQVLAALEEIPEYQRRIIELYYGLNGYEKMTSNEIAVMYKITLAQVHKRMFTIKKRIRDILSDKTLQTKNDLDISQASIEFNDCKTEIEELIDQLLDDPEEKTFIQMRLGINQTEALTETQIALHFGIEESKVREVIQRGLERIKKQNIVISSSGPKIN